jgi:hypothetical protein
MVLATMAYFMQVACCDIDFVFLGEFHTCHLLFCVLIVRAVRNMYSCVFNCKLFCVRCCGLFYAVFIYVGF